MATAPDSATTPELRPGPAISIRARQRLLLIGPALGYFMVLMDTTVANVALPAIGRDFAAGLPALQWIANGYTLTFAAFLLTAGTLSDRLGGRRVFLIGAWSFGILSALSAGAVTVQLLVLLRALLGVAGALLLPSSLSIVANTFADPAARARALGNWAAITGLALVAGPPAGGLLTELFGWRAVFLINVPIAVVTIVIVTARTRPQATSASSSTLSPSPQRGLDLPGQLTAVLALSTLTFGLVHAELAGWAAPLALTSFALCGLASVSFVVIESQTERRGGSPMLPLSLFHNRTFSAALFAGLVVNLGIANLLFTLSLLFQQERGFSSLTAGLAFLPLTVPTAVNPILTGRLVARIGPRRPATLGLILMAGGTALQALSTGPSGAALLVGSAGLLLTGFGISFALPALVAGLLTSVPREKAGIASGGLNSARQTGAVLGVALAGAVLAGHSSPAGTRIGLLICAGLMLFAAGTTATSFGRSPGRPG